MTLKITPEIRSALEANRRGPIPFDESFESTPLFLVRLQDLPELQNSVDQVIKDKLAEGERDYQAGRFREWHPGRIITELAGQKKETDSAGE